MENNVKVYFDQENMVEVHCYNQFTDYYFLNRAENYQFKTFRIGRLNYFTLSDLLKYWGKHNLPLGDLDTINKVSINILYRDLDEATKRLPSCVVDEKDLEKIYVDVFSSKMGLVAWDEHNIRCIADTYFSNLDYANFSKDIDAQRWEEYEKNIKIPFVFKQDFDNFIRITYSDQQPPQTGREIDMIVDSNRNLNKENIYNKKLLQREINYINSLRKTQGEK